MIKSFKQWINETNLYEESQPAAQPTKQQPTSQNPLCNSSTGTGGTGTNTPYKVCVSSLPQFGMVSITLTDTAKGTILASVNAEDFVKANTLFFDKVAKVLPGKRIGIELPMPINPDI